VLAKIDATNYNTQWVTPSGGGGGGITSGLYKVATTSGVLSSSVFDTSSFPSSIGTWSAPTATSLTLTFNSTYTKTLIPNYSGSIYWYNGTVYKTFTLPPFITGGGQPTVTFTWNGTNWQMVFTISGTTLGGSANDGTYGFFMYMNVFN